MVPHRALLPTVLAAALAAPHATQLIAEEGFAYSTPGVVDQQGGGSGWAGPWDHRVGSASQGTLDAGYSYSDGTSNLPEAGAARARVVGTGGAQAEHVFRKVQVGAAPPTHVSGGKLGVPGTSIWLAFLGRSELGGGSSHDWCGVSLYDGTSERLFLGRDGVNGSWRIQSFGDLGADASSGKPSTALSLVVARVDFAASNCAVSMWIDPDLGFEPLPGTEDAIALTSSFAFDEVRIATGGANVLNVDELRLGTHYGAAVAGLATGNSQPAGPLVTEPTTNGQTVNPSDVHMESTAMVDADAFDSHACSDFEIWRLSSPIERVWVTSCIRGVAKVHSHLGDGTFIGSHAGRTDLFPLTPYLLRIRHKDSSGDPLTEWSPWGYRSFDTGSSSEHFPLELEDVAELPAFTWVAEGGAPVILPAGNPQPSLRLESPTGELLLEIAGANGLVNAVTNPDELANHVAVKVVIDAGNTGGFVTEPKTDLTVFDDHCDFHRLLLPSFALLPGGTLELWVASDGSTYYASPGQTTPDFSTPARVMDPPWKPTEPGFVVEQVAGGFQLPVNIAFVPNPGPNPSDPKFYVTELYGTIKVVSNDGTVGVYATNLLDFNPTGAFPGSGEQGLTGIVVEPATGDVFAAMLRDSSPFNNDHHPKVDRFTSLDGGLTAATQTTILDMPGETQGQSHQISHMEILGGRLHVHMGDGFNASTAQNLDSFRGKILRMELDGSPVTSNPFYNAADGIGARDYVFAYGVRNPFGGAYRASDGFSYVVENGPSIDRFARIVAGRNYLWDGSNGSMTNFALYNWNPATGPVNIVFVQPETFGGSGFPAAKMDHAFVALSGPTYAIGPQANGKRIEHFVLDASGNLVSGPTKFLEYVGTGRATACALAAGPDGLYFSELYEDSGASGPTAAGARVLRVRAVPIEDCNMNGVADACDINGGTSTDWDQNGIPDECVAPPLLPDVVQLSLAAGGVQTLLLDAGASHAGLFYLLAGSASGTTPGLVVDGLVLPLQPDGYFLYTVGHPNKLPLGNTFAPLSAGGTGTATFTLPAGLDPGLAGLELHHAYGVFDTVGGSAKVVFTSNAVPVLLVP